MAVMKRPVRRAFSLLAAWLIAAALGCGSGDTVTIRAGRMLDGLGGERRDVVITITGSTIRAIAPGKARPSPTTSRPGPSCPA